MADEAHAGCRFYVVFNSQAQAVFTEVSGLQVEVDIMEYQEGGNNSFVHRLPGVTKVSNLTLKRGITGSKDFYNWLQDVSNGNLKRQHITVVMYDAAGKEVMHWDFLHAYPVKWIGPQLTATGNTVAVETLELAHGGISVG